MPSKASELAMGRQATSQDAFTNILETPSHEASEPKSAIPFRPKGSRFATTMLSLED